MRECACVCVDMCQRVRLCDSACPCTCVGHRLSVRALVPLCDPYDCACACACV